MSDLQRPVAYLEDHDFDSSGNPTGKLAEISHKVPVVVMIQASFCGHCNAAKPAFQQFANKHQGKVFCTTIHGDADKPSEQALSKRIDSIKPGFVGFPDYVLIVSGKVVPKEISGRDVSHLEEFAGI